jgi:bifunctional enzyme CysN/CysC
MNTLHREHAETFGLNEIGKVEIHTSHPLFFDSYKSNRATGSFILIDPVSNNTVAAGVIRGISRSLEEIIDESGKTSSRELRSPNIVWHDWNIHREERETRNNHKAAVLWLTGYSGSGKSTIARALERRLYNAGCQTMLLDGDNLRHGLCGDLGFSDKDRSENIRRAGETAKLFYESGHIVICAFISPFIDDRDFVRSIIDEGRFVEIYARCDLDVCIARDPNGLYKKVLDNRIKDFTGIDSTYEEAVNPEILLETHNQSLETCVASIMDFVKVRFF